MTYLMIFGLCLLLLIFVFSKSIVNFHSNWNTLIDDFDFSTIQFYELLEAELKVQGISNIKLERVNLPESGMFSPKRRYLRLIWKDYQYNICAAPFGKGFFISWWLVMKLSIIELIISNVPLVGSWLWQKFFPVTFYRMDTASMFMTYAHQAVLNVIEKITKEKGVRSLTENERSPEIRNIFNR